MQKNDYLARVEQAVRDNIRPSARIMALIEHERNERDGYWENIFYVAWSTDTEAGTHRVCIDSEDRSALFYGHYQLTEEEAVIDLFDRASPLNKKP